MLCLELPSHSDIGKGIRPNQESIQFSMVSSELIITKVLRSRQFSLKFGLTRLIEERLRSHLFEECLERAMEENGECSGDMDRW